MPVMKTSEAKARISALEAIKKPSTAETTELQGLLTLVAEREAMAADNAAAIKDATPKRREREERDKVKGDETLIGREAADRGIPRKRIKPKTDYLADSEPQKFTIAAVGDGGVGPWGLAVVKKDNEDYTILFNGDYTVGQSFMGRSAWINVKADQPVCVTTFHEKSGNRWGEFYYRPFMLGWTQAEATVFTGKVIEP